MEGALPEAIFRHIQRLPRRQYVASRNDIKLVDNSAFSVDNLAGIVYKTSQFQ